VAAKVFVTGRPGCGKTTVIRKTVERVGALAGGFSTEEIRERGRRLGFRVTDLHGGREAVLAHVAHGPPRVGKYGVDVAAFEAVGVAALHDALSRKGCVVIDEIGKMELLSNAFQQVVREVLDSDHPVLGTAAVSGHPFLNELRRRKNLRFVEVTTQNRDELPDRLLSLLQGTG